MDSRLDMHTNEKNTKSVDKFVSRMNIARVQKEEKEKALETTVGSGNTWKNKVTVPQPPALATSSRLRQRSTSKEVYSSIDRSLKSTFTSRTNINKEKPSMDQSKEQSVKFEANMDFDHVFSMLHSQIQSLEI